MIRPFFWGLVFFSGIGAAANPEDHSRCEALLKQAKANLTDDRLVTDTERIVEESLVEQTESIATTSGFSLDAEFLTGLVLPSGYQENEAAFKAARKRAIEELLPRLAEVQKSLDMLHSGMTFKERLFWLGHRYDEAPEIPQKTAVLAAMMKNFSIANELHYMDLIANGTHSVELKKALYKALTKIFLNDRTWQAPLESAMKRAGIK
jgi:hypothetical protein